MCVGAGRLPLALALVVVTALVLWPMDSAMGRLLGRASKSRELLVLLSDLDAISDVRDAVVAAGFEPRDVDVDKLGKRYRVSMTAHGQPGPMPQLLEALSELDAVTFVSAGAVDADVA